MTHNIPERMMLAIRRYIEHGIPPGDFLTAVICNDLREAIGRADDENVNCLPAYVSYFYNEAPAPCWGSREKMRAWIKNFPVLQKQSDLRDKLTTADAIMVVSPVSSSHIRNLFLSPEERELLRDALLSWIESP